MTTKSTTYVLVPGFWLGGWAWHSVAEALRERGHDVHPVTLTGMGERASEASPAVDLDTHIADLAELIVSQDLREVVLVGHSYGGLVITAVADRLPDRIARLVYVDTGPLPDGVSQNDFQDPDEQAANADLVASAGDGWLLPPPPWEQLAAGVPDVPADRLAELASRSVPQPWATATSPVRLTGAWESLPRVGILCSFTEQQARQLAEQVPLFAHLASGDWRFEELPTWHWPMVNRPAELASILDRVARAENRAVR